MNKLRILYLEDSQDDINLVNRVLGNSDLDYELITVDTKAEFENFLNSEKVDTILSDHTLFQFNSKDALRIFKEKNLDCPFILVTGTVSEEFAVEILKDGADDYVLKDRLQRLPTAIDNALRKKGGEKSKNRVNSENQLILELLNNVSDEIYVMNSETLIFTYVNQGACNNLGYSKEELLEMTPFELKPDISREKFSDLTLPMLLGEVETVNFQTVHKRKNDTIYPIEVVLKYQQINGHSYFVATARDITEHLATEERLKRLNIELKNSNEELAKFASVASHDMREPLRMIKSFLDLLERKYGQELDEKAKTYIHYAVDGAERMTALINDLLTYARIDGNESQIKNVDCNEVLNEVVELYSSVIKEKNANVQSGMLPTIRGKKIPIKLVFQNLINNALKYHAPEVKPEIKIKAEALPDHWLFSISDNGIGIEKAFHDQIFQVFRRLHPKNEYGGSGMGLAIAKKIVEQHLGEIWVESDKGKNSTFFFTIFRNL
ncbi:PAS domain S-box-containing protein [Belliella buryatensis]|uniref:histidine kinase n=1 Tax=Belliella buryatensis TaxID=1500549 RepID=A0A239GMT1_9BACT|nr:ATP-binding protein [Belliella buryatensis]SNS70068.1 PAS domain S-box-containing protein [Belliella buryatensis]